MSFHDWWATVVRWLLTSFFKDFLVLPVKKSDMSVKYKRLLNLTHHKHEPQRSLTYFCIEMLIKDTKNTKFRKLCFNGHVGYTSTNVHNHILFLYFSNFSKKKNYEKQN